MIVILEGLDGTGKTTLAQELEKTYGYAYIHRLVPETGLVEWYTEPLTGYYPKCGRNFVLDRWHLSEYVYSQTRRGAEMDPLQFRAIERYLSDVGAVIGFLNATNRELRKRHALRGEPFDEALFEKERSAFSRARHATTLTNYSFGEGFDSAAVASLLCAAAQSEEAYASRA